MFDLKYTVSFEIFYKSINIQTSIIIIIIIESY